MGRPATRSTGAAGLLAELAPHIRDERVLRAIATVPRDLFVPAERRDDAWANTSLPIAEGQTISQPVVVARMCELLALTGGETVLDVGTGSGYHAAVLALLARRVISVERHAALSASAREHLRTAGIGNVELVVGDGTLGHPDAAPYAAINVAAASRRGIPAALEGAARARRPARRARGRQARAAAAARAPGGRRAAGVRARPRALRAAGRQPLTAIGPVAGPDRGREGALRQDAGTSTRSIVWITPFRRADVDRPQHEPRVAQRGRLVDGAGTGAA